MRSKNIIRDIIIQKDVNASEMARALNTSRQVLHSTLTNKSSKDMTVNKLVAMANYLDYEVMVVPKEKVNEEAGYIVTRDDK